jgi:hypothetical protein
MRKVLLKIGSQPVVLMTLEERKLLGIFLYCLLYRVVRSVLTFSLHLHYESTVEGLYNLLSVPTRHAVS